MDDLFKALSGSTRRALLNRLRTPCRPDPDGFAPDPHSRLEMTFVPGWGEAGISCNVHEIAPMGGVTKLTALHDGLHPGPDGVSGGWARIAASLKSLLETGAALTFPAQALAPD